MRSRHFRDTGLLALNTGFELCHWLDSDLKTVCVVMRTEWEGPALELDGEQVCQGVNGMRTGIAHVWVFDGVERLADRSVEMPRCMATTRMKLSYVSLAVPSALEYRRQRTCQLAYYGRMGLGKNTGRSAVMICVPVDQIWNWGRTGAPGKK